MSRRPPSGAGGGRRASAAGGGGAEPEGEEHSPCVVCRIRPFNGREEALGELEKSKDMIEISEDKKVLTIRNMALDHDTGIPHTKKKEHHKDNHHEHDKGHDECEPFHKFKMTAILDMESTQENLFEVCMNTAMADLFTGYNCTIFAYGQTGSGKSWSMFGNKEDLELRGLIPRAVETMFTTINDPESLIKGKSIEISVCYIEVYQEKLTDLLMPQNSSKLKIRETKDKGVFVAGVHQEYVQEVMDVYKIIQIGENSKKKCATAMNPGSSRSHCCIILNVDMKDSSGKNSHSQLNMVDLAGSEKISKTGASGQSLEEAKKINMSLTSLSQVITALGEGSSHVPYRASMLTRLLQNSLGGNSKTSMICALSPHLDNYEETVSTLRFAQRCCKVKNKVKANTLMSAEELEKMLAQSRLNISKAARGNTAETTNQECQTMGDVEDDHTKDWACPDTGGGGGGGGGGGAVHAGHFAASGGPGAEAEIERLKLQVASLSARLGEPVEDPAHAPARSRDLQFTMVAAHTVYTMKNKEKALAAVSELVTATNSHDKCIYYGWCTSDDQLFCREAFVDAESMLSHFEVINAGQRKLLEACTQGETQFHAPPDTIHALQKSPVAKAFMPTAQHFVSIHGFEHYDVVPYFKEKDEANFVTLHVHFELANTLSELQPVLDELVDAATANQDGCVYHGYSFQRNKAGQDHSKGAEIIKNYLAPIATLFRTLDEDGSGNLDASELTDVVTKAMGETFNAKEFFAAYDYEGVFGDNKLDVNEFGWFLADLAMKVTGDPEEAEANLPGVLVKFESMTKSKYAEVVKGMEADVKDLFFSLDKTGDGTLSKEELKGVVSHYTGKNFNSQEFFSWFDMHGDDSQSGPDGTLDPEEFQWFMAELACQIGKSAKDARAALPGVLSHFKYLKKSEPNWKEDVVANHKDQIKELFMMLDKDKSGSCSSDELKEVVTRFSGESFHADEFLAYYDEHGKGKDDTPDDVLDLEEFGWFVGDIASSLSDPTVEAAQAKLPDVIEQLKNIVISPAPSKPKEESKKAKDSKPDTESSPDVLVLQEAFTSGEMALSHLEEVDHLLKKLLEVGCKVTRMDVHGSAACIEEIKSKHTLDGTVDAKYYAIQNGIIKFVLPHVEDKQAKEKDAQQDAAIAALEAKISASGGGGNDMAMMLVGELKEQLKYTKEEMKDMRAKNEKMRDNSTDALIESAQLKAKCATQDVVVGQQQEHINTITAEKKFADTRVKELTEELQNVEREFAEYKDEVLEEERKKEGATIKKPLGAASVLTGNIPGMGWMTGGGGDDEGKGWW